MRNAARLARFGSSDVIVRHATRASPFMGSFPSVGAKFNHFGGLLLQEDERLLFLFPSNLPHHITSRRETFRPELIPCVFVAGTVCLSTVTFPLD